MHSTAVPLFPFDTIVTFTKNMHIGIINREVCLRLEL